MGRIGKTRVFLGASAPKILAEIIDSRRGPLGWSRAKFTLEILELWRAQGCPPLSESDRLMQVAAEASSGLNSMTSDKKKKSANEVLEKLMAKEASPRNTDPIKSKLPSTLKAPKKPKVAPPKNAGDGLGDKPYA